MSMTALVWLRKRVLLDGKPGEVIQLLGDRVSVALDDPPFRMEGKRRIDQVVFVDLGSPIESARLKHDLKSDSRL